MSQLRRIVLIAVFFLLLANFAVAEERWQIVRAEYGIGTSFTDVTTRVQGLVHDGVLDFRVDSHPLGYDPAPHRVKVFRLQVIDERGRQRQLEYADKDHVRLLITTWTNNPGYGRGLQITRSEYGIPGHSRDVTRLLTGLVQADRLSVRVDNDTMGGDPAEDHRKTLTVWYVYNGVASQASIPEHDTLNLPGTMNNSQTLRIIRAEYGINPEENSIGRGVADVTRRLNDRIQGNRLSLRVTTDTMGSDPAEGHRKKLWVWYVYGGRMARIVVDYDAVLNLPGANDYYQERLQITRAQYGAGYRFADVTRQLTSRIQGDRLSLRITNDTMGGDPAPGEKKVLTVFYIHEGESRRAFTNESDVLELPAPDAGSGYGGYGGGGFNYNQLQIVFAEWGAGDRRADITDRLAPMVHGDHFEIRVNNGTMGGDPTPGQVSRLRVVYLWQGLRYEANVPEGGLLSLP